MKKYIIGFSILFSLFSSAQQKTGENITLSEKQNDDIYLSGENIRLEAPVRGDVVIAGGSIIVKDTVYQDALIAGGEITITGYVADDIRVAGGKLIIDSEIGDDVIVAGGEVEITKNAIIHGNLINFSGEIEMNGLVKGMMKSYSGDLTINGTINKEAILYGENIRVNGEINGKSKIVAELITIGDKALFTDEVNYWSENKNVDFKNSLINTTAIFNENLRDNRKNFSWKGFGVLAIGFWIFYLLSALLVLALMNWAFYKFFASVTANLEQQLLKSLGYGLIYAFVIPLVILLTFITIIGIPIGLFLGTLYLFSLLFGHLVTALLLSHYFAQQPNRNWSFWTIILSALGIAAIIRLVTFIPFLGAFIALIVITIGYGLISYTLLQKRTLNKLNS